MLTDIILTFILGRNSSLISDSLRTKLLQSLSDSVSAFTMEAALMIDADLFLGTIKPVITAFLIDIYIYIFLHRDQVGASAKSMTSWNTRG